MDLWLAKMSNIIIRCGILYACNSNKSYLYIPERMVPWMDSVKALLLSVHQSLDIERAERERV